MKIVFFGTPQFAAKTLKYLLDHNIQIVAVVTRPDKPKGRSGIPVATPVKDVALKHYLPIHQPIKASQPDFAPILEKYQADLFVVVAYGEIIKQHLLDMPRLGCINVHASLLPKYRGAAPIQHAIMNGETETGVTIMHMVKKMDAGDIIKQEKVPIGPHTTAGELTETLCEVGSKCLLEVISLFQTEKITETSQNEELVTYAPKIELENCEIDWNQSAQKIHDLVRGVAPHPGAWCTALIRGQQKRIKIRETDPVSSLSGSPGTLLQYDKNGMIIACGEGALQIIQLQIEGKKEMSATELTNGLPQEHFLLKIS